MISIWGTSISAEQQAVIDAGGIRVPRNAQEAFQRIIKTAFHDMQDAFEKHNIVLDPMLLEELEIFEVEVLNHFKYFLRDLQDETRNNKLLTKKMAKESLGEEVKGAFAYLSTLIRDCEFELSRQTKRIMRRVERHVFVNTTNNVNDWMY